mmetsp:Transcript_9543/g.15336  ORF Transcript_9543/g.15336 Transcript_9543/m.15336 type:complete len:207 (+) Transcript_9543:509-1129(+)
MGSRRYQRMPESHRDRIVRRDGARDGEEEGRDPRKRLLRRRLRLGAAERRDDRSDLLGPGGREEDARPEPHLQPVLRRHGDLLFHPAAVRHPGPRRVPLAVHHPQDGAALRLDVVLAQPDTVGVAQELLPPHPEQPAAQDVSAAQAHRLPLLGAADPLRVSARGPGAAVSPSARRLQRDVVQSVQGDPVRIRDAIVAGLGLQHYEP